MVMIFIFVLMTSQREMEMHHNHQQKGQSIHIQKISISKYEDVLPSVRTVADYKHLQASQVECDASMVNKKRNVKVTLHYDSTTRNSIDGEWPSLISRFSDWQTFRQRPIFFGFADWKQIASHIVKTYERLAAVTTSQWKDCYSC